MEPYPRATTSGALPYYPLGIPQPFHPTPMATFTPRRGVAVPPPPFPFWSRPTLPSPPRWRPIPTTSSNPPPKKPTTNTYIPPPLRTSSAPPPLTTSSPLTAPPTKIGETPKDASGAMEVPITSTLKNPTLSSVEVPPLVKSDEDFIFPFSPPPSPPPMSPSHPSSPEDPKKANRESAPSPSPTPSLTTTSTALPPPYTPFNFQDLSGNSLAFLQRLYHTSPLDTSPLPSLSSRDPRLPTITTPPLSPFLSTLTPTSSNTPTTSSTPTTRSLTSGKLGTWTTLASCVVNGYNACVCLLGRFCRICRFCSGDTSSSDLTTTTPFLQAFESPHTPSPSQHHGDISEVTPSDVVKKERRQDVNVHVPDFSAFSCHAYATPLSQVENPINCSDKPCMHVDNLANLNVASATSPRASLGPFGRTLNHCNNVENSAEISALNGTRHAPSPFPNNARPQEDHKLKHKFITPLPYPLPYKDLTYIDVDCQPPRIRPQHMAYNSNQNSHIDTSLKKTLIPTPKTPPNKTSDYTSPTLSAYSGDPQPSTSYFYSTPYGVPEHILHEIKSYHYHALMSTSTPFQLQDDYASILLPKKKTSIYDSLFTPSTTRYNKLTFLIMTRRQRAAHPHSTTSPNNDTNETSSHTSQHNLQNPMATAPPPPQEAQETEPLNSPPNNISEQDHQPLPPLQTTTASRPILPPLPPSSNLPLPRVDVISIPLTPPSEITPGLPTPSNTPSNTSLPQRRTIPPLEVPPYYPTLDPTAPSTNIARLAQRPKNFSGTGLKRSQDETKTWLGKMECWLTCIGTPSKDWATIATTYLDPPAFNVVQANVKTLQAAGTWQNTFQQFSAILLKNYGDVDADFAVRTRLARLRLQYSQDIVKYSKIFHELSTRITGEPLSDQAKISAFLT